MAKRFTMDVELSVGPSGRVIANGKPVAEKDLTKHQRQSLQLIGWTKGPTTKRAKLWRNLVG